MNVIPLLCIPYVNEVILESNKTENTVQILPRNGLSLLQSTDWDFDEYKEKSFEIRNIILSGQFSDQPDDKASK